jgi:hypothetical protein
MALCHPLDVEHGERDGERPVRQHLPGHRLRGTDHRAGRPEAPLELRAEALEELDVFGLLSGELEQRPHAVVVAGEPGPRVVQHEGQDELLDEAEQAQVRVGADLVEGSPLGRQQELERPHPRQGLGQERPAEVQGPGLAEDVLDAPGDPFRGGECLSVRVQRRCSRHLLPFTPL